LTCYRKVAARAKIVEQQPTEPLPKATFKNTETKPIADLFSDFPIEV